MTDQSARTIVVITLRRLGDVLLTTALFASLRRAYPDAIIDTLVFAGTEGMLTGNRDINDIITLPLKPSPCDLLRVIRRRGERYDIAISTQSGDRPTGLAIAMGRYSLGLVRRSAVGRWWKASLLTKTVDEDAGEHRIINLARLGDALGVSRHLYLSPPAGDVPSHLLPAAPYAVLHANPMYPYRRWHRAGWRGLATTLQERGLTVVATGGPAAEEKAYLDELWHGLPVQRLDGRLDFTANTALLASASLYVGPDTSMSHLAAAAGCPTVAIYGPASPHDIGPWPAGASTTPWQRSAAIQVVGKVAVVQKPLYCLPCQRTGCDNHRLSRARCLDELPLAQVLEAAGRVMGQDKASAKG